MPFKKKTKKKATPKKTSTKQDNKIDKLIENTLTLQKISIDIVNSNNDLNKRISTLVGLFEEASKNVGKVELSDKRIGELTSRIGELVDENKDLAKGLVLLEKYVRGRTAYEPTGFTPKPLPKI